MFTFFKLDTQGIVVLLDKYHVRNIEVIMLVDYSKDMTTKQLLNAHTVAKYVFSLLKEDDKIGFVVFNDIVHQSFKLQKKSQYQLLLEKKIGSSIFELGYLFFVTAVVTAV